MKCQAWFVLCPIFPVGGQWGQGRNEYFNRKIYIAMQVSLKMGLTSSFDLFNETSLNEMSCLVCVEPHGG